MSQLAELRVIVVEDNPHMRSIVCAILRGLGVTKIRECGDGAQALVELRDAPADVAIVDFNMAPVDGVTFTQLVRNSADSPNRYLPIIMLTGYTERTRVEEARDAGVTEFIVKPVTARAVIGRLESVIFRPRPFIQSEGYFGPDRRRRADPAFQGPWRRKGDEDRPQTDPVAPG